MKRSVLRTHLSYTADIGYGNYVLTAPGGDKSPSSRQTREMRFGSGGREESPVDSFDEEYEVRSSERPTGRITI